MENSRQFADFPALTPQISAAHSAVFAIPSLRPANKRRRRHNLWCNASETLVVPTIFHQRMGDPQHQRNIVPMCGATHSILSPKKSTVSDALDQCRSAFSRCHAVRKSKKPLLIGCIPRNFQRIEWISTHSTTTSLCSSTSDQLVCC